jgi:malonyl-CoA O-methyltransferase
MSAVLQLDKINVKRSFAKASGSYDALAELQRKIGLDMLRQLHIAELSGVILDLGCGTGFLTRELQQFSGKKTIIAMDIAMPMLQAARSKCDVGFSCVDIECLPVQDDSINWIFSNLALQWCTDLQGIFANFKRVLKPGGRLMFSSFGPQTLHELKRAWANVDNYSHVNDFYSIQQLHEYMQQAGLQNIQIENYQHKSGYLNVMALMKELKGIGAHNVTANRKKGFTTKTQWQNMNESYEAFIENGCLPATFDIIYVSGSNG